MTEVIVKHCTGCDLTKSVAEFGKNRRASDGLAHWCKPCFAINRRKWRERNPEAGKRYYEANRERILARQAERRAEDPGGYRAEKAAQARKARAADPERFREAKRAWRAANPGREQQDLEVVRARSAAWRAEQLRLDPEGYRQKAHASTRAWAKRYPERAAEKKRRRDAIKRGATIGPIDMSELWTGHCGICSRPLDRNLRWPDPMSKSLDHILPLAKGGAHAQGNLQWAHLSCNLRKGTSVPATHQIEAPDEWVSASE